MGGTAALSAAGLAAIEATPSSRAAASPLGRLEAGTADNAQLVGMHGNDERIYVDALARGTDFMYRVFSRFRS